MIPLKKNRFTIFLCLILGVSVGCTPETPTSVILDEGEATESAVEELPREQYIACPPPPQRSSSIHHSHAGRERHITKTITLVDAEPLLDLLGTYGGEISISEPVRVQLNAPPHKVHEELHKLKMITPTEWGGSSN